MIDHIEQYEKMLWMVKRRFPSTPDRILLVELREKTFEFIEDTRILTKWIRIDAQENMDTYPVDLGEYDLLSLRKVYLEGSEEQRLIDKCAGCEPPVKTDPCCCDEPIEEDLCYNECGCPRPCNVGCYKDYSCLHGNMTCGCDETKIKMEYFPRHVANRYKDCRPSFYVKDRDWVVLNPAPAHTIKKGLNLFVAFKPNTESCEIPYEVFADYGRYIAAGVLSDLTMDLSDKDQKGNVGESDRYAMRYQRGVYKALNKQLSNHSSYKPVWLNKRDRRYW